MNTLEEVVANIKRFNDICISANATLVLATKTIPADFLKELVACFPGDLIFGENKAQELKEKYFTSDNLKWHFIGRLQSNKIKYLIGKVDLIQSVDSISLVDEIAERSLKLGVVTDILVEINLGDDPQKGGISVDEVRAFASHTTKLDGVRLKGIMSVLPKDGDIERLMKKAKQISSELVETYGSQMGTISIGMSEDYDKALANSSNMIRIGSAIFGKRSYQL